MQRTIIAMSWEPTGGAWGKGPTVKDAISKLKKAGGKDRKGKLLLINAPDGAWIDGMGATRWDAPKEGTEPEPPFYIDRDGNKLDAQKLV